MGEKKSVAELEADVEGWKRIAVLAAVPLESYRIISANFPDADAIARATTPDMQRAISTAVVAIRMALADGWLPPFAPYEELGEIIRARATSEGEGGEE